MDGVAGDKSDIVRDGVFDLCDQYILPFGVRMWCSNEVEACTVRIIGDARVQLLDYGFGPFNL